MEMTGRKAVVCEDNWALSGILQHLLIREGLETVSAGDGEEGLQCVRAHQPSILVLDLSMPRRDGFSVLIELKRQPAAGLKVLVASHFEEPGQMDLVRQLGADAVLSKPFAPAEFASAVQGLLGEVAA